jgi:hypothetical protein
MNVEIFTLCDAATVDTAGKLNILGSFDRLSASAEPIVHMHCALALKLRFDRIEEGQKKFRLAFVDSDGAAVMPPLDGTVEVRFQGNDSTSTVSMALGIQQLKLPRFGEYSIDLAIDGRHEASIPLFVKQTQTANPSK